MIFQIKCISCGELIKVSVKTLPLPSKFLKCNNCKTRNSVNSINVEKKEIKCIERRCKV